MDGGRAGDGTGDRGGGRGRLRDAGRSTAGQSARVQLPVPLTLDDTVELFNLILGTGLTADEKQDLVAFLRAL
jgi:hypothetical protein